LGVARERIGEGRRIAETACDCHSLFAPCPLELRRMGRIAERTAGETGQQTDAERALFVAQCVEGALDERDQQLVVAGHRPEDSSAVAEGGAPEVVGQPTGIGQLGCLAEGTLPGRHVARSRVRLA